jgi:hypothetical protein
MQKLHEIGAAVLMVVLLGVGVLAQQGYLTGDWIAGSCEKCRVFSFVDTPGWSGLSQPPARVSRAAGFWIGGWGFECSGGGQVDRVDLWYQKDDGFWWTLPQPHWSLYPGLFRPDVQAAFIGYCPNVPATTGWHLYVSNFGDLPDGTRNIAVKVWRSPYFETHYRTITIVP